MPAAASRAVLARETTLVSAADISLNPITFFARVTLRKHQKQKYRRTTFGFEKNTQETTFYINTSTECYLQSDYTKDARAPDYPGVSCFWPQGIPVFSDIDESSARWRPNSNVTLLAILCLVRGRTVCKYWIFLFVNLKLRRKTHIICLLFPASMGPFYLKQQTRHAKERASQADWAIYSFG